MIEKKKRNPNNSERIVLAAETQRQLKRHAQQIEEDTDGIFSVPARELANFLLQVRSTALTETELLQLRERFFDKIKALKWATDQLQLAKARGEELDFAQVLKKIQPRSVSEKRLRTRSMARTKSNRDSPAGAKETATDHEAVDHIGAPAKSNLSRPALE